MRERAADRLELLIRSTDAIARAADALADEVLSALAIGDPVQLAGNGGAADLCSHFVAEVEPMIEWSTSVVRSLGADASVTTAVANDFGFDEIFAAQVRRHRRGLIVLVTTSGESENCVRAATASQSRTLGLIGRRESALERLVDRPLVLGLEEASAAQEAMLVALHLAAAKISEHIPQ